MRPNDKAKDAKKSKQMICKITITTYYRFNLNTYLNRMGQDIELKRAYEPVAADGFRVYVDRLWPRGLSHATFHCCLISRTTKSTTMPSSSPPR